MNQACNRGAVAARKKSGRPTKEKSRTKRDAVGSPAYTAFREEPGVSGEGQTIARTTRSVSESARRAAWSATCRRTGKWMIRRCVYRYAARRTT